MNNNEATLQDESLRMEALRRYEILDTPPDGAFDHITAVAARLLRVPIAIVSLVDHDRIWFKSPHGLDASETVREPGLCASAILSPELYEVRDARLDVRTWANPLVAGAMGLRFYAAVPLRTHDGFNLGTLCVIDREPRELSPPDAEILSTLAALVMDLMEMRLAARKIATLEQVHRDMSDQLREANLVLRKKEEEFRDLYEEAPVAYVLEGTDSRLISANKAALRLLGLKPEQVAGTYGMDLCAPTAANKAAIENAFKATASGKDQSLPVLELRRKDNGKPVWVQWWSSPAPDGSYTRTMFIDITDRILLEQEQTRLQAQNTYLYEEILGDYNFGAFIGESPGLRKVMQQTKLVGSTDASVLISGESGTGKELVARAIHEQSPRKTRPLIKVNCSAIPDSLFESEFFGHVRGAFTGAIKDKPGRFELAQGGTLFLDEIGEVPLTMQAKLLRVLQEQELERVGDTHTRKVDVRIIAATNRNLKNEVDAGRFRQDLFYRLSVFPIELLPLRERREDIPLLAAHFAKTIAQKMNRPTPRITRVVMSQLTTYAWPGNVRELQNAVERAVILSKGDPLHFDIAEPKPAGIHGNAGSTPSKSSLLTREELKRQERDNILGALKQSQGKVFGPNGAAELVGMKPTTLASRIKALRIKLKGGEWSNR